MDPFGCPAGYVTDRAFYANRNPPCQTHLGTFFAVTMSICLVRLIACLAKLHHYVRRAGWTFRDKRIVTMSVSVWSTTFYFLTSLLIGFNVATAANGWSFSLYSTGYLAFMVDFTMMLFKVVRLGKGIIALPRSDMLEGTDYLRKFTLLGRFLVAVQIIMATVSSVCLIIVSPALPSAEFELGTLGFATKGGFQFSCTIGMFLQFRRCLVVINSIIESNKSAKVGSSDAERVLRRMSHARNILRKRQVFTLVFGGGVGILLILLAIVIPWTWEWVLVGTAAPEAAGHLVVELLFNRPRYRNKTSSQLAANAGLPREEMSGETVRETPFLVSPTATVPKGGGKHGKRPWRQMLSMVVEESRTSKAPISQTAPYPASTAGE